MAFDLLIDMWNWYLKDIIGNEIIGSIFLFVILFVMLLAIGIPSKPALAFLMPVALGFILNAYLTWFGWLVIAFAGIVFGIIVYSIFER